jgi:hypothetical protein
MTLFAKYPLKDTRQTIKLSVYKYSHSDVRWTLHLPGWKTSNAMWNGVLIAKFDIMHIIQHNFAKMEALSESCAIRPI